MRHLWFVAALILAMQPVLANTGAPNGASSLAVIFLALWLLAIRRARAHS